MVEKKIYKDVCMPTFKQCTRQLPCYGKEGCMLDEVQKYSDEQSEIIHNLFNKPARVLEVLIPAWRLENNRPNVSPDRTKFYQWIVKRFTEMKKEGHEIKY